ncbi:MAG TPA: DUF5666 domain-containing protein [Anaerolineales bacterium]
MKHRFLLMTLVLILGLLLITTQALAGPANVINANGAPSGTPGPHGPGTQHTPGAAATAHAGLHGKPTILRGTISAVNSSSLTLTLTDGSSATVDLTTDTRINIPGPKSSGASLQIGMRAMVMAFTDANNHLTARFVLAIPGQPIRTHRVGWVTAYTAGSSITIKATDGNTYTFTLTADTKILPSDRASQLAVGSRVTIIAPRVPSALGWTATGIVVHPAGSGAGSQPPTATPTP